MSADGLIKLRQIKQKYGFSKQCIHNITNNSNNSHMNIETNNTCYEQQPNPKRSQSIHFNNKNHINNNNTMYLRLSNRNHNPQKSTDYHSEYSQTLPMRTISNSVKGFHNPGGRLDFQKHHNLLKEYNNKGLLDKYYNDHNNISRTQIMSLKNSRQNGHSHNNKMNSMYQNVRDCSNDTMVTQGLKLYNNNKNIQNDNTVLLYEYNYNKHNDLGLDYKNKRKSYLKNNNNMASTTPNNLTNFNNRAKLRLHDNNNKVNTYYNSNKVNKYDTTNKGNNYDTIPNTVLSNGDAWTIDNLNKVQNKIQAYLRR